MLGNLAADSGHFQQFGLAGFVLLFRSQFFSQVGMAVGPQRNGVADQNDGFDERFLFDIVAGGERIQGVQLFLHLTADAAEAPFQDHFIVVDPLEAGAEGRGFVHDVARVQTVGIIVGQRMQFRVEGLVQGFMIGFSLPERRDLVDDDIRVLLGDGEGRTLTEWAAL